MISAASREPAAVSGDEARMNPSRVGQGTAASFDKALRELEQGMQAALDMPAVAWQRTSSQQQAGGATADRGRAGAQDADENVKASRPAPASMRRQAAQHTAWSGGAMQSMPAVARSEAAQLPAALQAIAAAGQSDTFESMQMPAASRLPASQANAGGLNQTFAAPVRAESVSLHQVLPTLLQTSAPSLHPASSADEAEAIASAEKKHPHQVRVETTQAGSFNASVVVHRAAESAAIALRVGALNAQSLDELLGRVTELLQEQGIGTYELFLNGTRLHAVSSNSGSSSSC